MTEIYGLPYEAARLRVGSADQLYRVEAFSQTDGMGRGTRRLRVVNGGGLEFDVHPDRALDIGAASFYGIPISWHSPVGFANPGFYSAESREWLRTFGGGLLSTCGLDTFGPPSEDNKQVLGMHGRVGASPARLRRADASSDEIVVEGDIRQTSVLGENLLLQRRITTIVGTGAVTVADTVTNEGFDSSPHMILYHVNVGWPLLDESAIVETPSLEVTPRDEDAQAGLDERLEIGPPVPGFREQVFIYRQEQECACARVTNERLGLQLTLRYSGRSLPAFFQWKMTAPGNYVLGLEPANTPAIFGRAAARRNGQLPLLEPGESVSYRVTAELTRT